MIQKIGIGVNRGLFDTPLYKTYFKKLFYGVYLTKRMKQPRIDLQIRKCKWGWLGHTLQKPSDDIARQALEWNPQGKGAGEDQGIRGEERCSKRPKELIRPGRRLKLMPRTE
jgi:hypothetical protein